MEIFRRHLTTQISLTTPSLLSVPHVLCLVQRNSGQVLEGLVHVRAQLCRGLKEPYALKYLLSVQIIFQRLVKLTPRLRLTHRKLVRQIRFVPDHSKSAFRIRSQNLLENFHGFCQRRSIGDIINNHAAVAVSVVYLRESAKAFLASSVPNLNPNLFFVYCHHFKRIRGPGRVWLLF